MTYQNQGYLCYSDLMGKFSSPNINSIPVIAHIYESAGKSTVLSVLGNLTGRSSGSVIFEGGVSRPPRGTLGIVPQKNVLFPELTCYQTLRLWRAVKQLGDSVEDEDIEQLLRDCDLEKKIYSNANNLSGGQKRKLQLAIGLIGGSKSGFLL